MGGRHRIILGRYQDVRLGAEGVVGFESCEWMSERQNTRKEEAAVARVRRRLGNKCAKVFLAYLHGRSWRKTGIPKPTFYYALKKVEIFFGADKYWAELRSAKKKRRRRLD